MVHASFKFIHSHFTDTFNLVETPSVIQGQQSFLKGLLHSWSI